MATSILPGGHSHFDQGQQFYPQSVYHEFPQQSSVVSSSHSQYGMSTAQDESMPLATSQTWPSQISGRRGSSRSPNAHDRTPIRHRVSASRARSTSGSEALLAYATEQNIQQQQHQHSLNSTPMLQQSTPISSPPLFTTPAFASLSQASPFMQQQGYYDNSATPGFADLHSQHVSHNMPDYYPLSRGDVHTSPIGTLGLNTQDALYLQQAGQSRPALPSMPSSALNFSPLPRSLESTPGNIEVSSSRNKPQCWDHGCNGRQFSTFSNLLRHQREKSGTAAKARCPHCGTEFTRTTARNGHMYGGKCKGMPDSSKRSSISESAENSE